MLRVIACAALVLTPAMLAGCGREQPASAMVGTESIAVDDREDVLAFSGTTLDGEPFDLTDLRGRVVVINAWASWCAPCRSEMPAFVDLDVNAGGEDVAVIGLNVSDDAAAAEEFVEEFGMAFPNVADPEGTILASIPGVPPKSLPSTIILDRDGRIATRIIGPTTSVALASDVGQVLASQGG